MTLNSKDNNLAFLFKGFDHLLVGMIMGYMGLHFLGLAVGVSWFYLVGAIPAIVVSLLAQNSWVKSTG